MWECCLATQGGARGLELVPQLVVEEMDEGWTYPRELQWWPLCFVVEIQRMSQSEYVGLGIRESDLGEVLRELHE